MNAYIKRSVEKRLNAAHLCYTIDRASFIV